MKVQLVQQLSKSADHRNSVKTVGAMASNKKHLYGDLDKIVHYMDYQANPVQDNSRYVPDLVPGVLQPLEVLDEDPVLDEIMSEIDVEAIVKQAEECTADYQKSIEKDYHHFPKPSTEESLSDFTKKKYAPSTRKKALWARCIFEQWNYIHNFKIKQEGTNLEKLITGSLLTMDIPQLCEVLSYFILEIRKQSGEDYPHETLYEIVMSIQHFMYINGRNINLLDHLRMIQMHNTLDNQMKELSKNGVIRERNQAQLILFADEERIWQTGLLRDDTPEKLVNTLLYLIGIHFALKSV